MVSDHFTQVGELSCSYIILSAFGNLKDLSLAESFVIFPLSLVAFQSQKTYTQICV